MTRDISSNPAIWKNQKNDEVLVKAATCGLCHIAEFGRGLPLKGPLVLGHESAGVVKQVGPLVKNLKVVLLAPTGTLKDFNIGIDVLMMYRTIIGCCEGDSIPQWIQLYKEGRFPVDRIIHTYSFEELEKARDDAHRGKVMKAVVAMN